VAGLLGTGGMGWLRGITSFFVPVLVGKIVGGTAIFALMAWVQVQDELSE